MVTYNDKHMMTWEMSVIVTSRNFIKAENNNSLDNEDVSVDLMKRVKEWVEWASSFHCFNGKINVVVWCVRVWWWHVVLVGGGISFQKYCGVCRKSLYLMDKQLESCVCKSKNLMTCQ